MRSKWRLMLLWVLLVGSSSCSVVKYVPQGSTLLNRNKISIEEKNSQVKVDELRPYIQQTPNQEVFSFMKIKLGLYSMSSADTTKRINRWLRKVGEPPVIFDPYMVDRSKNEILRQLANKGYMEAEVAVDTLTRKRKTTVTYNVKLNTPYIINRFDIDLGNDSAMYYLAQSRDSVSRVKAGDVFDLVALDSERERIVRVLRNRGYYNFTKDMLYYAADSLARLRTIDVALRVHPKYNKNDSVSPFHRRRIGGVTIVMEDDINEVEERLPKVDTVWYEGYRVVYGQKRFIRARSLVSKVFLAKGDYYSEYRVQRTYQALNSLPPVKYVDISFREMEDGDLECMIRVNPDKVHVISAEVECTHSAGNIGAGASVSYQHKNAFKGGETFSVSAKGAYETVGRVNDKFYNAMEFGGDISLDFPKFLFPLSSESRKKLRATTELLFAYNYQKRPEYARNIASATYRYMWNSYKRQKLRYTLDLLDFSYIYLPWITDDFRKRYLSPSSSLRYSYEDHFIMRIGLGLLYTTKRENRLADYYTIRARVRTAGNLLYGISCMSKQKKVDGAYQIFNIRYAQFAKGEFDFAYTKIFSERHQLAFHAALGVAFPYGNADVLPFEERYYSGGANSVRGWSVRTLGPGTFRNNSGTIDFMRQSGDIKLDLSIEYRMKLFWLLEGALFVDAGNIWTVRNYNEQPGGQFRINEFYKQIAYSYGFGLRADFDFFILRFDFGFKLFDPALQGVQRWRTKITKDDFAFHFAIGYPF